MKEKIDTGFVYVGLGDFQPLPKPVELTAEAGDHSVLLSWNRLYYESLFVGYSVERSGDGGKTFQPTSDLPTVQPQRQDKGQPNRLMFKLDSLPENQRKYLFRVRGLTPFGQTGPASDAVEVIGLEAPDATPRMGVLEIMRDGKVYISWSYPWEKRHQLQGFAVERADKSSGPYRVIHKKLLPPTARVFTDTLKTHSAYYRVRAIDQRGQATFTHPHLVQAKDATPPTVPAQLAGDMDSTGVVTVRWKASPEQDVLGYRVYRANFSGDEYAQVTVSPVPGPLFKDKVNVQSLTATVYYKVVAVDRHFNESGFSEALSVKRPDLIPPVPPVFQEITSADSGVHLSWINSSSTDVVAHMLYRTDSGTGWELVARLLNKSINTYTDTAAVSGKEYRYTLVAVDQSGMESAPAKPAVGRRIRDTTKLTAQQVISKVNRKEKEIQLSWTFPDSTIKRFVIYRAAEDEPLRMFKAVEGGKTDFVDRELTINTRYRYRVRALYPNGAQSGLSKEIEVQF